MYRGGSLTDLFKAETTQPPTRNGLRDIADAAGAAMTEATRQHTPVKTGRTRDSWRQLPVRRVRHESGAAAYESGVTSSYYKARWLEEGTEPHRIEPKQAQAIDTPDGPRAGAEHPGTEPHYMTRKAAAEVEQALEEIAQPHLSKWAADIERRAKRHKGIE